MSNKEKDSEKNKRARWVSYERKHNITVPERLRNYIESESGVGLHDEDIDLVDLEGTIASYMRACEIYADYVLERRKYQAENKPEDGSQKRTYRRPLEKRLYLVEFVTRKVLGFHNLIDRSFTPHRRIGWKKLAASWNKKHPYDTMTPDRLRTEFYRIIRDKSVQREFFDRQDKEFVEFAKAMKESAKFTIDPSTR
jgi:hypothetical protein